MDVTWTKGYGNDDEQPLENSPINQQETYQYAGFWVRFWAYLIDVAVVFSLKGILLSPFLFVNDGFPITVGFWTVNGFAAAIIYYVYFFSMTKICSQTVGKIVIGIRVVKEDHTALTTLDIVFREVIGRMIYNILGILKVLYIVIGFTNEKQGLHDMIGKTRVIHVNEQAK